MNDGYRTGLCDCFEDCGVCLSVCCCSWTMCPSALNWADSRQEPYSLCHWCAITHPVWTRANIRKLNGIKEDNYCCDCCLYLCCFHLATCQDSRELKLIEINQRERRTNSVLNTESSLVSLAGDGSTVVVCQQGYSVPSYTNTMEPVYQIPPQPYTE